MITREEILLNLNKFVIAKGKPVHVHSSLKAIGEIEGGAQTLLDALIEYFTDCGGILCIPSHTWNRDIMEFDSNYTCVGALSKVALEHRDGIRSLHPTHSMVVFGDREQCLKFVENEKYSDTPVNPQGCYGNIYRMDGYVLLIGVNHTKNTFIHCVEEMLGVPERLTEEKAEKCIIHKDGTTEKRYIHWFYDEKIPDVSLNFDKYEPAFRKHGCIIDGLIGSAKVQLCSASKMKSVIEIIRKNSGGRELLADKTPLDAKLYL